MYLDFPFGKAFPGFIILFVTLFSLLKWSVSKPSLPYICRLTFCSFTASKKMKAMQGIFTKGKGSVHLTSLYLL